MEPRPDYTTDQVRTFRVALRAARGALTLSDLGAQLGYKSPSTTGHWEKDGGAIPVPPVVFAIEELLELDPGELSQHLGYLPIGTDTAPCTVESALLADPELDELDRDTVLNVYLRLTRSAGPR